jgi:hypothetical protein
MDFFINKGATLNVLRLELIKNGRYDYNHFYDQIQNAIITFTMTDIVTGVVKIGNATAATEIVLPESDCCEEYLITYQFSEKDTCKAGVYIGKFKIQFLDGSGTLIMPIAEELKIHVMDGSIKKEYGFS